MNFFIIPGNPPAAYFYELWKQEILEKFPQAQVHVSRYPELHFNHDSTSVIDSVANTHLSQLESFYEKAKGPITIVGHSLGGYFSMRLAEKIDETIIKHIVLIHPFLRSPTLKGKNILRVMSFFHEKQFIHRFTVKNRKYLERLSKDLPHVTDAELITCFQLAGHEHWLIAPDNSPLKVPSKWQKKASLFYTDNDTWCSPQVIASLKNQIATHKRHEPHGFVTERRHRDSLFEQIQTIASID